MALIPTLNTQRLRLRPMNLNDWPAYAAFTASDRCRHKWDFFGVGALMMEDHESGCCLGQVGINTGPLFPEHEIGWLVFLQAEGLGYAFEAASALRDWARDVRHLPSLVSYVHKDNTRSCKLAERLGAIPDKAATGHAPGDVVYRHFGPQAG